MVVVLAVTLAAGRWLDSRVQRFEDVELDAVGVLPADPFAAPASEMADPTGADSHPTETPEAIGPQVRSYLVYSTGSAGMTREEAVRFGVADLGRRGEDGLTDVMMVVLVDEVTREAAILSIPRDTWLPHLGTRINGVLDRDGLQAMVDAVTGLTGLPVNHLIEVNFTAFGELVAVLGGVPVQVDTPLRDYFSGLWLPETGCILLDPLTALAYVRSRHTESPNVRGGWGLYGLGGDFARTERQRRFLAAAWDDLRDASLVSSVPRLFDVLTRNVTVDEGFGLGQVRSLASAFQGIAGDAVESYLLPGDLGRAGEASVVRVDEAAAQPILARLRNWPPTGVRTALDTTPAADGSLAPAAADAAVVTGAAPTAEAPTDIPTTEATDAATAPCTREVATPAPGTPPPGRPPAYLLEYVYGPPEAEADASGAPTSETSEADDGNAASTAPEPPEPAIPAPDPAVAEGVTDAAPEAEVVPEPVAVPEPIPMPAPLVEN